MGSRNKSRRVPTNSWPTKASCTSLCLIDSA
jgi:hypothetical protein